MRDDQRVAPPELTGLAAPGALAPEGAGDVRPGALQRRHQTEQGAGHDRDAEREREDVPVETEVERNRRRQREVRGGQQVEQPDRQPDAGAAGQQAQQRRLGQQTPHERPARRAQRQAHRDLLAPVECAGEQEAGEVGARQQQHQPDDHHQQPRRRPDEDVQRREDQHVGERQEHELPGWIPVLHAVPSELRGYRPDDRLGLGQRDAWPETCLGEERVVAPIVDHRGSVELLDHHVRNVERRRQAADGAREVGRPHPDHRVRAAADAHLVSDDVRVAGECALPVSIVEHHDRMPAARDVVARQQGASDRRLDSQQREVAAGDRLRGHHADASNLGAVDRHRHELGGRDVAEGLGGAVADILEIGVGQRAELERCLVQVEVDDLFRPLDRRVAEDHRVDEAEDGRVGPDAEREREDGNRRERRAPGQGPNAVAGVALQSRQPGPAAPAVTHRILVRFDAAEGGARPSTRFPPVDSRLAHQALRFHVEMEAELLVHPLLYLFTEQPKAETGAGGVHPPHQVLRNTAPRPSAKRCQLSISSPSARRPDGVSR